MTSSSTTTTTTTTTIPETMKRLVLTAGSNTGLAGCEMEVQTVPMPIPKPGQVLVKVAGAAVNPSDHGRWPRAKPEDLPMAMGNEGCGVVVQTGGGGNLLQSLFVSTTCRVGQKVGFVMLEDGQGAYSEYVVVEGSRVFPMPADLPIEDAASFFVNPYTALAIMDTAAAEGSKAFVHTAAASQLGQMIVKHAAKKNVEPINVVRRAEQVELLKGLGAKHVICTADADWKEQLKRTVDDLGCTVAFDAVAGDMTNDLLGVLPNGGTVFVYGGLSGAIGNVNPRSLIYDQKTIRGFMLMTSWVQEGGPLKMIPRMILASKEVNSGLSNNGWSSSQFKDTTMETLKDDLVGLMASGNTGQKLRVRV
jgi:NADPH2:quinone reductase